MLGERAERERVFWDAEAGDVERTRGRLGSYIKHGVEPNLAVAIDWLGPLSGKRVLDFACGTGALSYYLASKGAQVTGIDVSEASLVVASKVPYGLDITAEFRQDLFEPAIPSDSFDAVIGQYALHHVDVRRFAPELARILRPGGRAAFLETIALNPVLMGARRYVVGRFGIPRWGTADERPLHRPELDCIREAFGEMTLDQAEYRFLSMIDEQGLRGRAPRTGRLLRHIDASLSHVFPRGSYHQVLLCRKTA